MEGQQQLKKSRVVKVNSEKSWDLLVTQATKLGCPVLIHFTASWCIPSIAMNSIFEDLALSYKDIMFLVVDVDELKAVAAKMEIKAMPTFLLIKEGTTIDKIVGANPNEMKKRINVFSHSNKNG